MESNKSDSKQGAKSYVTHEELESRLTNVRSEGPFKGLGCFFITALGAATLSIGLAWGAVGFLNGPFDGAKMVYSTVTFDEGFKHQDFEYAKALYARREHLTSLDEEDLSKFYLELGCVSDGRGEITARDVSWYRLCDWIEDND